MATQFWMTIVDTILNTEDFGNTERPPSLMTVSSIKYGNLEQVATREMMCWSSDADGRQRQSTESDTSKEVWRLQCPRMHSFRRNRFSSAKPSVSCCVQTSGDYRSTENWCVQHIQRRVWKNHPYLGKNRVIRIGWSLCEDPVPILCWILHLRIMLIAVRKAKTKEGQYHSLFLRWEHLAGQNMERLKSKLIISRQMNLDDTR